jgi:hypothetical protein
VIAVLSVGCGSDDSGSSPTRLPLNVQVPPLPARAYLAGLIGQPLEGDDTCMWVKDAGVEVQTAGAATLKCGDDSHAGSAVLHRGNGATTGCIESTDSTVECVNEGPTVRISASAPMLDVARARVGQMAVQISEVRDTIDSHVGADNSTPGSAAGSAPPTGTAVDLTTPGGFSYSVKYESLNTSTEDVPPPNVKPEVELTITNTGDRTYNPQGEIPFDSRDNEISIRSDLVPSNLRPKFQRCTDVCSFPTVLGGAETIPYSFDPGESFTFPLLVLNQHAGTFAVDPSVNASDVSASWDGHRLPPPG